MVFNPSFAQSNAPTLTHMTPALAIAGEPGDFTLAVFGSGFRQGESVVRWNGSDRPTTFVSEHQLTTRISAQEIAAPGPISVTVFTPGTGGGATTGPQTFTVYSPPRITRLKVRAAAAGTPGLTLTLYGTGFLQGPSVVLWNGSIRTTTFISENELSVDIPATDLAAPGIANITVFNAGPGGGMRTAPALFTINSRERRSRVAQLEQYP